MVSQQHSISTVIKTQSTNLLRPPTALTPPPSGLPFENNVSCHCHCRPFQNSNSCNLFFSWILLYLYSFISFSLSTHSTYWPRILILCKFTLSISSPYFYNSFFLPLLVNFMCQLGHLIVPSFWSNISLDQ